MEVSCWRSYLRCNNGSATAVDANWVLPEVPRLQKNRNYEVVAAATVGWVHTVEAGSHQHSPQRVKGAHTVQNLTREQQQQMNMCCHCSDGTQIEPDPLLLDHGGYLLHMADAFHGYLFHTDDDLMAMHRLVPDH